MTSNSLFVHASDATGPALACDDFLSYMFDPRFVEAQKLAQEGQVAEALGIYRAIGATQSARHFQDALVLAQRGDASGATASLKKAVAADPANTAAWAQLAKYLSGAEVERAYRKVLDASPRDVDAAVGLAQLLMKEKRLQEATQILETLLPNQEIEFILAHVFWQLGDFPSAERHLRQYIEASPGDARAYETLLDLLNRDDRLQDAEALCRCFLEARGENQGMTLALARVLLRQERFSDAETILAASINSAPDDLALWQFYAELLEKSGRADEALAVLEKNVEMSPGNLDSQLQLADFLYRSGNKEGAEKACLFAARVIREANNWGLRALPSNLESRLIFYRLEEIAGRLCTGTRSLVDTTGLDPAKPDFGAGQIVELFCMVSGQEHVDFLEYAAYPALSSTEGFDRLLQERTVVYNIYTTPSDLGALKGFLSKLEQRGIRYRVNVELLGLSQDLYAILSLPIIDQVRRSLAMRSIVVMALPDAIISGSIHRVIGDMKPGETVVCAMPRINTDLAYPALRARFAEGQGALNSRDFVHRAMTEFRHPQTHSALVSDSPCLRYREGDGYYSAHNWAPPPLCFYAREEMLDHMMRNPLCGPHAIASFYTVDHDFVDSAFKSGALRLIDDSDYFFWAEFTGPTRHCDFLAGRKAESYYYPESARYVFQHEFKWIYRDPS
ncbi:tetratricopeptide repeat protein [Propionivibrio soli]|uniref:tetratricopeptide repeat protein n=1 Tax=Propionivibrio soli TaxID=2976531 RepID=UPI0021E6F4B4|nr:tetratricopeptide repeat protein [Propionivibrio soli]